MLAAQPQAAGQVAGFGAQVAQAQLAQVLPKIAFPYYVLRFDDKGYRFTNFADVEQNYSEAKEVERVIFVVDSGENRQSGGMSGTQLELRLDARDASRPRVTTARCSARAGCWARWVLGPVDRPRIYCYHAIHGGRPDCAH